MIGKEVIENKLQNNTADNNNCRRNYDWDSIC